MYPTHQRSTGHVNIVLDGVDKEKEKGCDVMVKADGKYGLLQIAELSMKVHVVWCRLWS